MPKEKQFSIALPDQHRLKLDRLAKEDGRSRTGYIKRLVALHLREQEGTTA